VSDYVVAVGAANVDVQGFTYDALIMRDSNPGRIETCLGGVSRNISENLIKLGTPVKLITAIGQDLNGSRIIEECAQLQIDLTHSLRVYDMNSSTYMAIMDESGDMALALSDMSILDRLSAEHLENKADVLEAASVIVMDAGLTTDAMTHLVTRYAHKKIFLDPVSVKKCGRMKDITGRFYCIKMNRLEAGFLAGMEIQSERDLHQASDRLMNLGVRKCYVTLGSEGVYYRQEDESGIVKAPPVKLVNATGAGDAFTAAAVYGELHGWAMRETACFAVAAAAVALSSRHTVSEVMSTSAVRKMIKECGIK
jgi:pseudouridine kinase